MSKIKIIETIRAYSSVMKSLVKPTTCDKRQFEANVRRSYLMTRLDGNVEFLEEMQSAIGHAVYQFKDGRPSYAIEPNDTFMNTTLPDPIILTQELYNQMEIDMVKRWIEYYTKQLVEQPISSSSTDKLANIEKEWQVEEIQNLIKFYKNELLGIYS